MTYTLLPTSPLWVPTNNVARVGATGTSGSLDNQHPEYACRVDDWRQMRDTWSGQRAVKARNQCYLPATSGMEEDWSSGKGVKAYNAYLMRALFHSFVSDAVDCMLGMMWNKPPTYEIPKELEYLLPKASTTGEGLKELHRSINRQQLVTGRMGLLVDLPGNVSEPLPYIAPYYAEAIVNWDAGFRGQTQVETTNLVVLNESGPVRRNVFGWEDRTQYRVLMLGDPEDNEAKGIYRYGVFGADQEKNIPFDFSQMIAATSRGQEFDHIPWTFINANSTLSSPCDPPLIGLSDLCLAIYRLEADYRQALFMQTQDTLFTKGFTDQFDKPLRTGAGGRIHAQTKEGDAKYIGVASQGLPELRTARENDLKMAASKAGELMDASSRARESGTALEMRIGSKTSTMMEIAISAGEGLQRTLRDVAQWKGVKNLDSIIVKPNFEFASREFLAMDFSTLVQAKMLGGPISFEAIHKYSQARGGPGADLTFKQMMQQIEDEGILDTVLAPKITPKEEADLELQQQSVDVARTAAQNKPKPASGAAK